MGRRPAVGALLAGVLDAWPDPLVLLVTDANIDAATFARVLAPKACWSRAAG